MLAYVWLQQQLKPLCRKFKCNFSSSPVLLLLDCGAAPVSEAQGAEHGHAKDECSLLLTSSNNNFLGIVKKKF